MLHQTIPEQAAAYLFHLVQNHPFIDGNKRVGFAAMDAFLRINGYRLEMSDDDAFRMMMEIASGAISREELAEQLEGKTTPD